LSVAGRSSARNGLTSGRSTQIPSVGTAGSAKVQAAGTPIGGRTVAASATAFAVRSHGPDVMPIGI
jgi:hypothetical protein